MSRRRWILAVLIALVVFQFIPVDRTNPPVTDPKTAPPDVQAVLQRSCYDCHSNRTVWPWYAHVAPVSWLVAHDVHEGRSHLNFSAWRDMEAEHREHIWNEMREQIDQGEMPLTTYLWVHRDARLSDDDKALLRAWTRAEEQAEAAPR
jgi:hypothetical protein